MKNFFSDSSHSTGQRAWLHKILSLESWMHQEGSGAPRASGSRIPGGKAWEGNSWACIFLRESSRGETCERGTEVGHGRQKGQKRVSCQGSFSLDLISCRRLSLRELRGLIGCAYIVSHWIILGVEGLHPFRGQFWGQHPGFSPRSWGMQYQLLK